jgi:hypothetical protein
MLEQTEKNEPHSSDKSSDLGDEDSGSNLDDNESVEK